MTQKTCAVTGANGFAGGAFCEHFAAMGWHIIKLVRVPEKVEGEARRFVLGEAVTPGLLEGVDLVVHAAYDFSLCSWADIRRVNARGSEALFDAAYKAGVKRQVFISSMAAFEGCRSHYGLGKLLAEEAMCARGGISIRPGMIYSEKNGGLAAKIAAAARILPVVPMIGSGHYPLYTCHIGDLCALVAQLALMENPLPQTITAANDRPVTLRTLAKAARPPGKFQAIAPVPWPLLYAALWCVERTGLRLGFRSDSVISLVNANPAPDFSALSQLGAPFRSLK